jgi:very-short-patch-repair endonuclease
MPYIKIPGYIFNLCRKLHKRQTKAEEFLWTHLRGKNLNGLKFRRQHPLGRYIADFYCREARLVIELEGSIHNQKDQKEYDKIRQEILQKRDLRVLRIKNKEIEQNIEKVVQRIVSLTSPRNGEEQ